jgi:hypothetical protein
VNTKINLAYSNATGTWQTCLLTDICRVLNLTQGSVQTNAIVPGDGNNTVATILFPTQAAADKFKALANDPSSTLYTTTTCAMLVQPAQFKSSSEAPIAIIIPVVLGGILLILLTLLVCKCQNLFCFGAGASPGTKQPRPFDDLEPHNTVQLDGMQEEVVHIAQPEDVGLPPGWRYIKTEDGNDYYWNDETEESCWERPTA